MYQNPFLADPDASFTKEEMHLGKHQEYEKKLHDTLIQQTANKSDRFVHITFINVNFAFFHKFYLNF